MRKIILAVAIMALCTFGYVHSGVAEGNKSKTAETATTTTTTDMMAKATPMAAMLSDGESAEVMVTINEGEIDLGQLAKRKAVNKQVKDYAKMMVDQHKNNEKEIKRVARKQDLDFKKTDMSKSLEAKSEDMERTLKKTAKADFDRAYMDQQIDMHEEALDTVTSLIDNAQNKAYKAHLEKTRDAITVHLAHAKEVQGMIK